MGNKQIKLLGLCEECSFILDLLHVERGEWANEKESPTVHCPDRVHVAQKSFLLTLPNKPSGETGRLSLTESPLQKQMVNVIL